MTLFKHILVGTDFSPRSLEALDTALALARHFGSRLTLVHALPEASLHKAIEEAPTFNPQDQPVYALRKWLDKLLDERTPHTPKLRSTVALGQPSERMVALTHDLGCDLVVVATTGKGLAQRLMFGSTAEALIQKSAAPVWLAPPGTRLGFQRVVAGFDYTEASMPTVQSAVDLSCAFRGRLDLVHVARDVGPSTVDQDAAAAGRALVSTETHRDFESWCVDNLEMKEECWARTHLVVRQDKSAARALLDQVESSNADVLVVGSHRRGAFYETFVGSTAKKLMKQLPCNMLVTRDPGA